MRAIVGPGVGNAATVKVDAALFDETPDELTANARAAVADSGTLRLSTARAEGRNDPTVVITIADDAAGMDDDTCRRAKEPFSTTRAIPTGRP
ncbi:hypothetical protein [Fodinicurvata sp. EGI_FJ10296]|uniref:hypothetical protein n=1 Tax=Fodinicurvata sp. EGI_FJ10296 TaxID=3231908 RepID=UPI0034566D90